jgi:hypothetical protein
MQHIKCKTAIYVKSVKATGRSKQFEDRKSEADKSPNNLEKSYNVKIYKPKRLHRKHLRYSLPLNKPEAKDERVQTMYSYPGRP